MSRYELCKFSPAPDPELICGICMNVLDTPQETPCRHVFCCDCISKALKENTRCPTCRASCMEDQPKDVLPLVQNLINKLTMRCDNYSNGCEQLILKEFFLDHILSCDYRTVQCRFAGCSSFLLKKDCDDHETNICTYRDRMCQNGCGLMIPIEETESHNCIKSLLTVIKVFLDHILSCDYRTVQCRFAGCSSFLLKKDCDDHETNICTYRDRMCQNGCGLMIPIEETESHNCIKSLLTVIKELKDKNIELLKTIDDLKRTQSNRVQSAPPVSATGGYEDQTLTSDDADDESFSFASRPFSSCEELDLSDFDSSASNNEDISDYSNESRNSETSRNGDENVIILNEISTNDGDNNLVNSEHQEDDEVKRCSGHSRASDKNSNAGGAALIEVCSQTEDNNANSPFVLGFSGNVVSPKSNTEIDLVTTGKTSHEEVSGNDSGGKNTEIDFVTSGKRSHEELVGDNSGGKKMKQTIQSPSLEYKESQTQTVLLSESPSGSNVSNSESLIRGRKRTYSHKNTMTESQSDSKSSNSITSFIDDAGNISNPTGSTQVTHQTHRNEPSSSDSADTLNSSTSNRNEHNPSTSKRCPVTRSRGRHQHIQLKDNVIPNVKVPPTVAYLLNKYAQDDDSSDESWSPCHEK